MFSFHVLAKLRAAKLRAPIWKLNYRPVSECAGTMAFPDNKTATKEFNVSWLRPGACDDNAFRFAARPNAAGCGWGAGAIWGT
jgi:hypothetical protein